MDINRVEDNAEDNSEKVKTDIFSLDDEITNEKIEQIEKAINDKSMQFEFKEALEEYEKFLNSEDVKIYGEKLFAEQEPDLEGGTTEKVGEDSELYTGIDKLNDELARHMNLLETLFETKIMADGQREKLIDSLHAELEQYKNDMFAKIFKPILCDIIYLREDMRKIMRNIRQKDDDITKEKFLSILDGYIMDTADILEKYDVEIFDCAENEYVPIKQKIIKILPADCEQISGTVAEKLSDGYSLNDRVIFPQKAVVYKFNQNDGGEK